MKKPFDLPEPAIVDGPRAATTEAEMSSGTRAWQVCAIIADISAGTTKVSGFSRLILANSHDEAVGHGFKAARKRSPDGALSIEASDITEWCAEATAALSTTPQTESKSSREEPK